VFDVVSVFHAEAESPLMAPEGVADLMRPWAAWLGAKDEQLAHWYLGGKSLDDALQYEAFAEGANGHTAVLAVLNAQRKKSKPNDGTDVFLWNGEDSPETGASMVVNVYTGPFPSRATLKLGGSPSEPRIGDYKSTAEFLALMVCSTHAECAFVYDQAGYGNRQTFEDRPGVGWMLYLPRVLAPTDVPEARALIPVTEDNGRRGTIIVSVTDAVFDDRNTEHLKVARDIETRLVSNDWLPTWTQLVRQPRQ
jgi:hypothetical protein